MKRRSPAYYRAISHANPHWRALRAARYQLQGGRCAVCHLPLGRSYDCHHTGYKSLGRERLADVRCVHRLCHKIADSWRKAKRRR